MSRIGFSAQNISAGGCAYPIPIGVAVFGWSDSLQIDQPGGGGEAASWRFTMRMDGSLSTSGAGSTSVALSAFKNEQALLKNLVGFDRGGSDGFATDRQRVGWSTNRGNHRELQDVVTFAEPITLGPSFVWRVCATVRANPVSSGFSLTIAESEADFDHALDFGSGTGLYLVGVAVDGFTMASASGIGGCWPRRPPSPAAGC